MILFLLKKTFYDLWDNLFRIMILNLGFWLSLSLAFILPPLVVRLVSAGTEIGGAAGPGGPAELIGLALFFALLYWLCVYLCAAAAAIKNASDYRTMSLGNFVAHLKKAPAPALILFAAAALICALLGSAARYVSFASLSFWAAAFFCCWLCLGILGIIQFYPAAFFRIGGQLPLKGTLLGTLKKCAVFFFDNPGFCLFSLFVTLVLSVPVLPFPCWSLLFLDEGLRLRMLKYSVVQEKTGQLGDEDANGKRRINWNEILAEEKEKTGSRTWRDFLFPWKE
jgi:hypothetical protein